LWWAWHQHVCCRHSAHRQSICRELCRCLNCRRIVCRHCDVVLVAIFGDGQLLKLAERGRHLVREIWIILKDQIKYYSWFSWNESLNSIRCRCTYILIKIKPINIEKSNTELLLGMIYQICIQKNNVLHITKFELFEDLSRTFWSRLCSVRSPFARRSFCRSSWMFFGKTGNSGRSGSDDPSLDIDPIHLWVRWVTLYRKLFPQTWQSYGITPVWIRLQKKCCLKGV
jgi:hypothetical protein